MSFGRDPERFDRYRPDYPLEVVSHVEGLVQPESLVEIGAGTGIATKHFARAGRRLVCLEPAERMAAMLSARRLPGVRVITTTFEAWDGDGAPADLIYAAQAWHWVDAATGFQKALASLRPGGLLALLWNIPIDRFGHLRGVYEEHAPELLSDDDDRIRRRDRHDWSVDMTAAGFREVGLVTHHWARTLTAGGYRALCSTYSDHILMDPGRRELLLDAIEAHIAARGGSVEIEYRCLAYTGRR